MWNLNNNDVRIISAALRLLMHRLNSNSDSIVYIEYYTPIHYTLYNVC